MGTKKECYKCTEFHYVSSGGGMSKSRQCCKVCGASKVWTQKSPLAVLAGK